MTSTIREEIKKIIYFIVYLILEVSIFFIITKTLGGISIPNFRTAFLVIILLSLVNAILWLHLDSEHSLSTEYSFTS